MSRLLSFDLEPSDALLALLRLKATSEAGRWPAQLSGRFRASLEREFAAMEGAVRTIGACYNDLEERGIAAVSRGAHSRFGDVDAAMHLASFAIGVAVDLDHLKVALERGDVGTRRATAGIATSLRMMLWYAVRTDLLLCTRLQRSGEDITPDAALRFVDGYLVAAWKGTEPPQPPIPLREPMADGGGVYHTPVPAADALPGQESTAVFNADTLGTGTLEYLQTEAVNQGALVTAEMDRLSVTHIDPPRAPMALSAELLASHITPRPFSLVTTKRDGDGDARTPSFAELDPTALPTLQIQVSNVLSDDARFFLAQSGARWPCDATELASAHHLLTERLRQTPPAGLDPAMIDRWAARLDRGYDELRRWAR